MPEHHIDLKTAIAVVSWLAPKLGVTELHPRGSCIVGAVRRQVAHVTRIELLLPLPTGHEERPNKAAIDPLHNRIADLFALPMATLDRRGLFEPFEAHDDPARPMGSHVAGLVPGFRRCELSLYGRDRSEQTALPVVLHRYVPGGQGNYGWLKMLTTGPASFVDEMERRWRRIRGIVPGEHHPATEDGFPLDHRGEPVACQYEEEAFDKCGRAVVAASDRRPSGAAA